MQEGTTPACLHWHLQMQYGTNNVQVVYTNAIIGICMHYMYHEVVSARVYMMMMNFDLAVPTSIYTTGKTLT